LRSSRYASQDETSRNLATLARHLAREIADAISFDAYRVAPGAEAERDALASMRKRYGVTQG